MNMKGDCSPSASADESTKFCLIYAATDKDVENPDVEISYLYVTIFDPDLQTTDADTNGVRFIVKAQPTFRFDGLEDVMGFCVSKSTLYIIDSHNRSPLSKFLSGGKSKYSGLRYEYIKEALQIEEKNFRAKKSVYSYDLAQYDSSSDDIVLVQKSELVKVQDMHGGKVNPVAAVTPDGKILVYSTYLDSFSASVDMVEFEIYDPSTEIWSKLPPPLAYNAARVYVGGSGLLTSSVFLIVTDCESYVIDLAENERVWRKYEPLDSKKLETVSLHVIEEEGVCLTDYALKSTRDWDTVGEYYQLVSSIPKYILDDISYERNSFTNSNRMILSSLMGKVDGDGYFKFCCIQAVHHKEPLFILDVFRANRDKQEEENKFIISKQVCLMFSPPNLKSLDDLYTSCFLSVQFSATNIKADGGEEDREGCEVKENEC